LLVSDDVFCHTSFVIEFCHLDIWATTIFANL
jgi:hypothetical protein